MTASKPRKRVMRSFKLDEISAVDRPAQKPATAPIMKRDAGGADQAAALLADLLADPALAKMDDGGAKSFAEIVAEKEERRKAYAVAEKLWPLWDAVQESIRSIACDGNLTPAGKIAAVRGSIDQFADAVRGEFPELAEEIGKAFTDPALGEIIAAVRTPGGDPVTKENPMTDNTSKVAELEAQIATLKADNTTLAARAEKAEADLAKAEIAKTDEVLVIDGETIRKSETPAGTFALLKKQAKALEAAAFEKRAEAELPAMPGEPVAKGAALAALAALPEADRAVVETMLKAGNEALAKATREVGAGGDKTEKSELDQIDELAKKHAAENGLPYHKAYDAVLATDEGRKLYAASQKPRAA
jgi:hypothetical protein